MKKFKKCKVCDKEFLPYSSFQKHCSFGCNLESKESQVSKKKKSIRPISDKKMKQLAIYRPLRDKYLKDNPTCEVVGCNNNTTNLHHKAGRIGKFLTDVNMFMACCSSCHPQKIHFDDVHWAYDNGYLIKKV